MPRVQEVNDVHVIGPLPDALASRTQQKQMRRNSIGKTAFRPSVFNSPVTMESYLGKKSSGPLGRYQKRYFTLAGHYLKYFESEVCLRRCPARSRSGS